MEKFKNTKKLKNKKSTIDENLETGIMVAKKKRKKKKISAKKVKTW